MRLVVRPIDVWPGTLTPEGKRQYAQFSASWSDTVDLLEREAKHLGVRDDVVLQLAVTERDCRLDGWIRADARPTHPGAIVSMETRHGPLRYSTDLFTGSGHGYSYGRRTLPGWQANVRAIALGLEALRKVDRYGIAKGGEQYVGYRQLGAGTPMGPAGSLTVEQAAVLLCDATAEEVGEDPRDVDRVISVATALWRDAAKKHHPDVGGDPEYFRRLTEAKDLLVGGGSRQ